MAPLRERGERRKPTQLRPLPRDIVVYIPNFRIEGKIEFLEQSRFSDFLNGEQNDFVLVREASIYAADTGRLQETLPELQVNKEVIVMAFLVP
ncbi:hypothetical protein HS125_01575 [bacterium]|nr:hypothetical protein [bacterium]